MKIVLGTFIALIGALALTYWRAPVWLLDRADRLISGDQGVARIAEGVSFGAHPRLKLDIWAPKAKSAKPLPVIVFFYGGGWHWGERDHYGFAARSLAAKGFVVVVPDYRLVPDAHFPDFVADSAAAVRWSQAHISEHGGDPTRIAVMGHSAGAYNALMVALDPQWLGTSSPIKAVVALSGPTDFYPFTTDSARNAMGNAPDPRATQPVNFARADAPPLLLIHGTADTTVRIRNARNLKAAMDAAQGNARVIELNGVEHNLPVMALSALFKNRIPVLEESVSFLHENWEPKERYHADQGRRVPDSPDG
jgi:acetyl esterase/lipase